MGALDPVLDRMIHNGHVALQKVGDDLAGKASDEAPILTGDLRASPTVEVVVDQAKRYHFVRVSFALPYAARQHEELDWVHPRGGKAHYLSDPLKANALRYEQILGKAILHPQRLPDPEPRP